MHNHLAKAIGIVLAVTLALIILQGMVFAKLEIIPNGSTTLPGATTQPTITPQVTTSGQGVAYYLKYLNAKITGFSEPVKVEPSTSNGETSVLLQSKTISAACIDKILSDAHSQATGKGNVFYSNAQKYNVDPAVALAFFRKENSLCNTNLEGTTDAIACKNKSTGNIKCTTSSCYKGFNTYSTWDEGIEAWFVLISGNVYVGSGLNTIEKIVPKYAPPTENDTPLYISQTKQWTEEYRAYADKTC